MAEMTINIDEIKKRRQAGYKVYEIAEDLHYSYRDVINACRQFRITAPAAKAKSEEMTPRELEAINLVAMGYSNEKIAQELGISSHTSKFHVDNCLTKLNARNRTQAVVIAIKNGIIQL